MQLQYFGIMIVFCYALNMQALCILTCYALPMYCIAAFSGLWLRITDISMFYTNLVIYFSQLAHSLPFIIVHLCANCQLA